jgi:hypothetical protein
VSALVALMVPLLAAPVYELGFMERTELRLRTPGDAVDVEQSAGARVSALWPRTRLTLGYVPRLSLSDLFYDVGVDLLHTGEFGADFEWRRVRLSLSEHAAYGTRNFNSLEPGLTPETRDVVTGGAGTRMLPIAESVSYGSSDTTLTLTLNLSRRSDLELAGGYLLDGGLEEEARLVIPFVYGPRARVEWRYQVARRDSLATAVDGESLTIDSAGTLPDFRSDVGRGRERWSHRWSRATNTELSAGAAVAQTDLDEGDPEVFPIGGLLLTNRTKTGPEDEFVEIDTSALVDVVIDRLTGLPDHRLDVGLKGTWTREPYAVYANVGETQSLRPEEANALVLYSGEVGGRYHWTRPLWLDGGFRGAYQSVDAPTSTAAAAAASGFNWVVFVALQAQTDAWDIAKRQVSRDEKEREDP